MKQAFLNVLKKIGASVAPLQNLVLISLAAWVTHIILRVLLLFRSNPYGFPFVSKPDWFIFHAVCIDFMWIVNALVVFLILGNYLPHLPWSEAPRDRHPRSPCPRYSSSFPVCRPMPWLLSQCFRW